MGALSKAADLWLHLIVVHVIHCSPLLVSQLPKSDILISTTDECTERIPMEEEIPESYFLMCSAGYNPSPESTPM